MKTRNVLMSLLALGLTFTSMAQTVENDDVYFNSKDRPSLKAQRALNASPTSTQTASDEMLASNRSASKSNVNPTDSYSARTVNPEYTSRSSAQTAQTDNQDYFLNNYQYSTAS